MEKRIRIKILIWSLSVAVIPILLLGIYSIYSSQKNLVGMMNLTEDVSEYTELRLKKILRGSMMDILKAKIDSHAILTACQYHFAMESADLLAEHFRTLFSELHVHTFEPNIATQNIMGVIEKLIIPISFDGRVNIRGNGSLDGQIQGMMSGSFKGYIQGQLTGTVTQCRVHGSVNGTDGEHLLTGMVDAQIEGEVNALFPEKSPLNVTSSENIAVICNGVIRGTLDGALYNNFQGSIAGEWSGFFHGAISGNLQNQPLYSYKELFYPLKLLASATTSLSRLSFIDTNGYLLSFPQSKVRPGYHPHSCLCYKTAIEHKTDTPFLMNLYYDDENNEYRIAVLKKIQTADAQSLGVLVIEFDMNYWLTMLVSDTTDSFAFLCNRQGKILVRQQTEQFEPEILPLNVNAETIVDLFPDNSFTDNIKLILGGAGGIIRIDSQLSAIYAPAPDAGWVSVLILNHDSLIKPLGNILQNAKKSIYNHADKYHFTGQRIYSRFVIGLIIIVLATACIGSLLARRWSKTEQSLHIRDAAYKNLVANIPDITYTLKQDGSVEYMSPRVLPILGYTPDEMYTIRFLVRYERIHPHDAPRVKASFNALLAEKKEYDIEYRLKRKDGNWIWVQDRAITTYKKNNCWYVDGLISDITERKHLEKTLKKQIEEFKLSSAELEQYAYITSHDLQEPLQVLTSYLELFNKQYSATFDSRAKDYINRALENATQMRNLIRGLLDYANIVPGSEEFQIVDMNDLIGEVVTYMNLPLDQNNGIVSFDELPMVKCDRMQFYRLFQNLIENSLQFCKATTRPRIHISSTYKDNYHIISVSDNGVGIDQKYHNRIFQMFEQISHHADSQNLGVGLTICKKIVENHGGVIWVDSEPGAGATFSFSVPAIDLE